MILTFIRYSGSKMNKDHKLAVGLAFMTAFFGIAWIATLAYTTRYFSSAGIATIMLAIAFMIGPTHYFNSATNGWLTPKSLAVSVLLFILTITGTAIFGFSLYSATVFLLIPLMAVFAGKWLLKPDKNDIAKLEPAELSKYEQQKYTMHIVFGVLDAAFTFIVFLALAPSVLSYLLAPFGQFITVPQAQQFSGQWFSYLATTITDPRGIEAFAKYWYAYHSNIARLDPGPYLMIGYYLFPIVMPVAFASATNQFANQNQSQGRSRFATPYDIRQMRLPDNNLGPQVGWDNTPFLGRANDTDLVLKETLLTVIVASPGTGKSVAFAVPTILHSGDKNICLLVNDVKPELFDMCAGYLSTQGFRVFRFAWGAVDKPDQGIYYPAWNPLGDDCPDRGPDRDLYIDSLWQILCPEPKDGEKHWSQKAQQYGSALTYYAISQCEQALWHDEILRHFKTNNILSEKLTDRCIEIWNSMQMPQLKANPDLGISSRDDLLEVAAQKQITSAHYACLPIGTWEGVRANHVGKPASFPMLIDMITDGTVAASTNQGGQAMTGPADPIRDWLLRLCTDIQAYGYDPRALTNLSTIANTPDKERGSISSTMDRGLKIFDYRSVRERTSRSDLRFRDMRGYKDPKTGEFQKIAVFFTVTADENKTYGPLTALFMDLLGAYLVKNGPNATDRTGTKVGPNGILYLLDEMPQLPTMKNCILEGPAVGRSKKIAFLVIAQTVGQIEDRYGKTGLNTIMGMAGALVALPTSDFETAEYFSKISGDTTKEEVSTSYSNKLEFSGNSDLFGKNYSKSFKGTKLISPTDVMSLPKLNRHYVLIQSFFHRPIYAETAPYFKSAELSPRVWNPKMGATHKYAPPPPMPAEQTKSIIANLDQSKKRDASARDDAKRRWHLVYPNNADPQNFAKSAAVATILDGKVTAVIKLKDNAEVRAFFKKHGAEPLVIYSLNDYEQMHTCLATQEFDGNRYLVDSKYNLYHPLLAFPSLGDISKEPGKTDANQLRLLFRDVTPPQHASADTWVKVYAEQLIERGFLQPVKKTKNAPAEAAE